MFSKSFSISFIHVILCPPLDFCISFSLPLVLALLVLFLEVSGDGHLAIAFLLLCSTMLVLSFHKDDRLIPCLPFEVWHFSDQSSLKYVNCSFMVLGDGPEFTIIEKYTIFLAFENSYLHFP